jgi:hypothetical protein
VLPGGRNFGQKAQKGPGKIELAGRLGGRILAEFYVKWQKKGQRKFSKEVPSLTVLNTFRDIENIYLNFELILWVNFALTFL